MLYPNSDSTFGGYPKLDYSFLVLEPFALSLMADHPSRVFSNETLLAGLGMVEQETGIENSQEIMAEIARMEAVYTKKTACMFWKYHVNLDLSIPES